MRLGARRRDLSRFFLVLAAGAAFGGVLISPVRADDSVGERVMFVVSGGRWSGGARLNDGDAPAPDAGGETGAERGFYRLIAVRGSDNRTAFGLDQIALVSGTPKRVAQLAVSTLTDLRGYVIDMRQDGPGEGPPTDGFSAFVTLKRSPTATETETWTVIVDEFGKVGAAHESN